MVQIKVSTPHLSDFNRTIGLHAQFKSRCRETRGSAIWKHTLKKPDTVGEIGSGSEGLAESCWRPMPQEERQTSSHTRINATNCAFRRKATCSKRELCWFNYGCIPANRQPDTDMVSRLRTIACKSHKKYLSMLYLLKRRQQAYTRLLTARNGGNKSTFWK